MGFKGKKSGKISKESIAEKEGTLHRYPVFCFRYMTKNKDYNLEKGNDGRNEGNRARSELLKRIHCLSTHEWDDIRQWRKNLGYECESMINLRMKPIKCGRTITDDSKLTIFRFGLGDGNNGRLVGILDGPIYSILYIDWDLSLYDHGS